MALGMELYRLVGPPPSEPTYAEAVRKLALQCYELRRVRKDQKGPVYLHNELPDNLSIPHIFDQPEFMAQQASWSWLQPGD